MLKKLGILTIIICFAVLFNGCGQTNKTAGRNMEPNRISYEVKDATGHILQFSKKPQRIISIGIAADEMLVGLVPLDRIAALSFLSDDAGISNITAQAAKIKTKIRANAEIIIGLQPDLVLMADWQAIELLQILRDAKIPVYVYKTPSTIDEVQKVILELSLVVGEKQNGEKIVAEMNRTLQKVAASLGTIPEQERLAAVRYTFEGVSGGEGSLFNDIFRYAQVTNPLAKIGAAPHNILPKEKIVELNPDILILPQWELDINSNAAAFKKQVLEDPSLKSVSAVHNGRVIIIPDKHFLTSSQWIVLGVEDVARAAYPAKFK